MINAVNDFLDDLRGGRMTEAPVVTVEQGQLQGRIATSPTGKNFYSFQGIPYAKPPLGSLRFQAPHPAEPWEGIRDATSEGNVSAQFDFVIGKQYTGDENCLFLNVYTPNLDGEFLPVMVYIHGGGFKFGSGNSELYGPDYLVEKDVVVVTINYRCGVLGFLCLNTPEVPGNAGLKDMVEALRWVKTNIHNFGGNSGNITIFGESAGGYAVNCLMISPLSKNLINKAIMQSGTGLCPWGSQKKPLENAKTLAKNLGCEAEEPEEILEFLRACSAKEIVDTHTKALMAKTFPKYFEDFVVVIEKEFPGVEGFLTESIVDFLTSGRVANVPIMIGACTLEFGFDKLYDDLQAYIPDEFNIERDSPEALDIVEKIKRLYFNGKPMEDKSEAYYQLMSDRVVKVDTHRVIQYLVQVTNKPIYYYNFDYVGSFNLYGKLMGMGAELNKAAHMDELGYLFRNIFQNDVEPSAQDIKTRERMLRLWTNFAKCGNPTPDENHYLTVAWPPVTKDNLTYLNISNELSIASNPDKERMDFWDDFYSKHFRIWEHPKTNTAEVLIKYDPPVVVGGTETVTIVSSEVTESKDAVIETTEIITVSNDGDGGEPVVVSELIVVGSEPVVEANEQVAAVSEPVTEEPIPNEPSEIEPTPLNIVDGPTPLNIVDEPTPVTVVDDPIVEPVKIKESDEPISIVNNHVNGDRKARTSNEIKMVSNANGAPKDVIRANDPPEDDLPKNIGVNKFVNFFESLGGKK